MEIFTKSAQETQKLGEKFAIKLRGGEVITLRGDLGSGKTTFVQGIACGLGIKRRILSPTFVLSREYSLGQELKFYHVDLYRIESIDDVRSLGLNEIWDNPKNILIIEWPEKIEKILPKKRVEIIFDYIEDDERKITFSVD